MRTVLFFCVLMIGTVGAAAQEQYLPPPAKFDHEPTPPPIIQYVDKADADAECRFGNVAKLPYKILACSGIGKKGSGYEGRCLIIVSTRAPVSAAAQLRHEKAHCNGWRHPNF
ncbi:hypothetical protein BH10PSE9_BH10PSE9_11410 [soil metagenome]